MFYVSAQDVGVSSAFSIKRWFEEKKGDEVILMVHIKYSQLYSNISITSTVYSLLGNESP